jgi:seryl-tRNA synthetase
MLDLKAIRRDPEPVRAALGRRRDGSDARLGEALQLDERRRALLPEVESLRARQNEASQSIAQARRPARTPRPRSPRCGKSRSARRRWARRSPTSRRACRRRWPRCPTADPRAPDEDTPLREVGRAGAAGRDHLELAGSMIDTAAGARVAGSRFVYLTGDLVMLELALVRWALELVRGHGFEPVIPPCSYARRRCSVRASCPTPSSRSTGWPTIRSISPAPARSRWPRCRPARCSMPSGCPALRGLLTVLPARGRSGGARHARHVRVHQFEKVEMFAFVEPDTAADEHERLLSIEEEILQALEIPYRVVDIAVSDLGASAVRKFDCEAWLPGQERYRELTSTSNTTDFQARRLDIRYRADGGSPRHVHTLNGTAVAVGRTMIALLENGQREDGTVVIPEVLHAWGAPKTIQNGEVAGS